MLPSGANLGSYAGTTARHDTDAGAGFDVTLARLTGVAHLSPVPLAAAGLKQNRMRSQHDVRR